jgi:hypothetical protein
MNFKTKIKQCAGNRENHNEKWIITERKHGSKINSIRSKRNWDWKRESSNWRRWIWEALPLGERGEKKKVNLRNVVILESMVKVRWWYL